MGHSLKTADARYYLRKKQMSAATAGKTIRCLYAYTSPEKTPEKSPERTPKMSPQRTPRKKMVARRNIDNEGCFQRNIDRSVHTFETIKIFLPRK